MASVAFGTKIAKFYGLCEQTLASEPGLGTSGESSCWFHGWLPKIWICWPATWTMVPPSRWQWAGHIAPSPWLRVLGSTGLFCWPMRLGLFVWVALACIDGQGFLPGATFWLGGCWLARLLYASSLFVPFAGTWMPLEPGCCLQDGSCPWWL